MWIASSTPSVRFSAKSVKREPLPLFPGASRPLWFAHRGCSSKAPENTLPAFRLARDYGIPGVELDLQLTADGEIIVFHDPDFSRICGSPKLVRDSSIEEIRTLDAGSHKSAAFAGTRVPTLRELLEELGRELLFDLELKYYSSKDRNELVSKTALLIEEFSMEDRALISSFDPRTLRRSKERLPGIPHGLIYDESSLPRWLSPRLALSYARADFEKPVYRIGPRTNRDYLVWTVDDREASASAVEAGAAGIISNRPEDLA